MAAAPPQAALVLSPVLGGAWRLHEWALSPQQRLRWIEERLALGVTSFDHADVFGDARVEALFGEALALAPALRDRMQLVCTLGLAPGAAAATPAGLQQAVHAQLRALRTEHLDLLLLRPGAALPGPEAAAQALAPLLQAGQVRQLGLAHATAPQLLDWRRALPVAAHQLRLSPLHPEPWSDGTLAQCAALGLPCMAWAPLAGGRIFKHDDARALRLRAAIEQVAATLGCSATTAATAWVRHHPCRPRPVIGALQLDVVQQACQAQELQLSGAQWQTILQAGQA